MRETKCCWAACLNRGKQATATNLCTLRLWFARWLLESKLKLHPGKLHAIERSFDLMAKPPCLAACSLRPVTLVKVSLHPLWMHLSTPGVTVWCLTSCLLTPPTPPFILLPQNWHKPTCLVPAGGDLRVWHSLCFSRSQADENARLQPASRHSKTLGVFTLLCLCFCCSWSTWQLRVLSEPTSSLKVGWALEKWLIILSVCF
jgi:hypothetical protein